MSDLFKTLRAAVALGRPRIINTIMREADFDAEAALVWAAEQKATEMATLLLKRKRKLAHTVRPDGMPLLIYAVKTKQLKLARVLLERGADPNVKDQDGFRPLMYAHGLTDNMLKLLLEFGADPNMENNAGDIALILRAAENKHTAMYHLLVHGADINHQNAEGWTALMKASFGKGNARNMLYRRGGRSLNIDTRNNDGNTAMMLACKHATTSFEWHVVEELLDRQADINAQNKLGETALMLALQNAPVDFFEKLLRRGPRTDLRDNEGRTVMDRARALGKSPYVALLEKYSTAA